MLQQQKQQKGNDENAAKPTEKGKAPASTREHISQASTSGTSKGTGAKATAGVKKSQNPTPPTEGFNKECLSILREMNSGIAKTNDRVQKLSDRVDGLYETQTGYYEYDDYSVGYDDEIEIFDSQESGVGEVEPQLSPEKRPHEEVDNDENDVLVSLLKNIKRQMLLIRKLTKNWPI